MKLLRRLALSLFFLFVLIATCGACAHASGTRSQFSLLNLDPVVLPTSSVTEQNGHRVVHLTFSDILVTKETVDAAIDIIKKAGEDHAETLVLELNTRGGSVPDGLRLMKIMERAPMKVVCVVDGEADSEGFFLLQGCQTRLMTDRSQLMVHEPYTVGSGTVYLNREFLQEQITYHDVLVNAWTAHCARRLKISLKELRKHIRHHDWWMASDEALSIGAVDAVVVDVPSVLARALTGEKFH